MTMSFRALASRAKRTAASEQLSTVRTSDLTFSLDQDAAQAVEKNRDEAKKKLGKEWEEASNAALDDK